ncbi:MAG: 16S rRNA (uracil(1498)-N(3))-methyltransferase [Alistipes sp.]|nr:16S rRNA (uracil(1498)-N(3))-methyltransferase [Alistipes sp.]
MHLFYTPNIGIPVHTLDGDEGKHAVKVLRLRPGDPVRLTDGRGNMYSGSVESLFSAGCTVRVTGCEESYNKRGYRLTMAVAPTKNFDRYEWFLEKATEAGCDRFIPVICERSERRSLRLDRGERVITSAVKQCHNAYRPTLCPAENFHGVVTAGFDGTKLIAHCDPGYPRRHIAEEISPGTECLMLIGPEGDFSPAEIEFALENGFRGVSLGRNRLRTETAALYAVTALSLINA